MDNSREEGFSSSFLEPFNYAATARRLLFDASPLGAGPESFSASPHNHGNTTILETGSFVSQRRMASPLNDHNSDLSKTKAQAPKVPEDNTRNPKWVYDNLRERAANPMAETACDRRPQAAGIAGALQYTCGIDIAKEYDTVHDSTIKIRSADDKNGGSGFYACTDDKKFCAVVTNDHVVATLASGPILLLQDGRLSTGTVAFRDAKNDLAVIEINKNAQPKILPPVSMNPVAFAQKISPDEKAFSVCYPMYPSTMVSAGVIRSTSMLPKIDGAKKSALSISSDQVLFHGCSGAANFNSKGEVIGVVRAVRNDNFSSGLTISIRNEHVHSLLESYKQQELAKARRAH